MSDKLKELLEKPSLYDVIALFVKYCTDDTSRIKVRERAIMYLLYDEWGNFGEKAPAGLKDLLKDVAFSRSPCCWSNKISESLTTLSFAGIIAWISNTDYYWVERSYLYSAEDRLPTDAVENIRKIADKYLASLQLAPTEEGKYDIQPTAR